MPTTWEGAMILAGERRRLALAIAVALICLGAGAASASAAEFEYDLGSVAASESSAGAARHPDLTTVFAVDEPLAFSSAKTKDVDIELPAGFYGNPNAVPRCSTGDFLGASCPIQSQVGISRVSLNSSGAPRIATAPLYSLEPPHPEAEVARLGFIAVTLPVFIDISVRTAGDYGLSAQVHDAPALEPILGSETIVWGNPADPSHDKRRLTPQEAIECSDGTACKAPGGERESGIAPGDHKAFLSNPSACGPLEVGFAITSYQLPGQVFSKSAPLEGPLSEPPPITDCQGLPFAPSMEARPTTDVAGAPSGLKASLTLPQGTDPSAPSTATMREAKVTLPEGFTVNPAAADGLGVCSDEAVHFHEELNADCPDAAKLGTARISSPPLPHPIEAALYQRSPGPKGDQFRVWLVSDELGLHIKIPGEVKPDPSTGQLTFIFKDLPQVPFSQIDIDVFGGPRAPLKTPDHCGTFQTTSVLTPHSEDPPVTSTDSWRIERSPNGGPCPSTAAGEPNTPSFEAGTTNPISATYSPFALKLSREDGSQPFGSLELTLPPGLTGRLADTAECSDGALAQAQAKSGREELASPSCPEASLLGTVWAAAGAGPSPFWAKGKAYLAAPYKGAPLSLAVITPAVAGPFDLGNSVVRSTLRLEPGSAQITLKSDPIPQILEGVPLDIRTIAAGIDRDHFTLNGTSCDPLAFKGTLLSALGSSAPLSQRFQLAECSRLGFKPKLSLALRGKSERTGFPSLRATYRSRGQKDANLKSLTLRFPRSEFIEQGHFRTICTRVQWAAGAGGGAACPKGSVYGHIRAYTPLLQAPLEGSVYLRSSDHNLPDVVFALRGKVDAEVAVRIDSVKGGLNATIEEAPDVPLTKAVLTMQGGQKGLFVNSRDTCAHTYRASLELTAHNAKTASAAPPLANSACKKQAHGRHKPHAKHAGKHHGR
jgi:hypothetical protein